MADQRTPSRELKPRRVRTWIVLGLIVAVAFLVCAPAGLRYWRSAGLLMGLQAGPEIPVEPHWGMSEVQERQEPFLVGGVAHPGRVYWPTDEEVGDGGRLVLVHGVHWRGIEEPRLRAFARSLASAGVSVFTPQVEGLTRYEIGEDSIAAIGAAAQHFDGGRGRVGVMGISFGGGLALVAVADPMHGEAIDFVVAVGAHHDLTRVVSWYAGESVAGPDGESPPVTPHPYGPAVAMFRYLDHFIESTEVELASSILRDYLRDDGAAARARLPELSAASRASLREVLEYPPSLAWRRSLLSYLEEDEALSRRVSPASSLANIAVPVFLVHGEGDPIVPATETSWLARDTPESWRRRAVITPLLRHAEAAGDTSWSEQWRLVSFMADVLAAAESGAD